MSTMYDTLAEVSRRKKTKMLRDQMTKLLEGHENISALSVLVSLLATVNLDMHVKDSGVICSRCSAISLTELLQSVRKFNDEVIDAMPDIDE